VLLVRGGYQVCPDLPFIPGAEVYGEIVAGHSPDWYEPGTRVAALLTSGTGGLAQYALASRQHLYLVPGTLGDAEGAALVSAFGTAWCGLRRRAELRAGKVLVVTVAAGGVGSAAVQLGKAYGATVIGVARGAEKAGIVRELGADAAVDCRAGSVAEQVRELTGGRQCHH
jgi:NADPH2:quinone reductase